MKLSQIREEKAGEQATGIKAWFSKNKGIVLAGSAVVLVAGGYLVYKYVFKKKGSSGPSASPGVDAGDMDFNGTDGIEYS